MLKSLESGDWVLLKIHTSKFLEVFMYPGGAYIAQFDQHGTAWAKSCKSSHLQGPTRKHKHKSQLDITVGEVQEGKECMAS